MLHPKVLPQFYVALCYILIYCFCLKVVETSQNGKFFKLPTVVLFTSLNQ